MIAKLIRACYAMFTLQAFSIVFSLALPIYDQVKSHFKSLKYKSVDFEEIKK